MTAIERLVGVVVLWLRVRLSNFVPRVAVLKMTLLHLSNTHFSPGHVTCASLLHLRNSRWQNAILSSAVVGELLWRVCSVGIV